MSKKQVKNTKMLNKQSKAVAFLFQLNANPTSMINIWWADTLNSYKFSMDFLNKNVDV